MNRDRLNRGRRGCGEAGESSYLRIEEDFSTEASFFKNDLSRGQFVERQTQCGRILNSQSAPVYLGSYRKILQAGFDEGIDGYRLESSQDAASLVPVYVTRFADTGLA